MQDVGKEKTKTIYFRMVKLKPLNRKRTWRLVEMGYYASREAAEAKEGSKKIVVVALNIPESALAALTLGTFFGEYFEGIVDMIKEADNAKRRAAERERGKRK